VFAPSKQAGHMGATDQHCMTMQEVLANRVPSTHGMARSSADEAPTAYAAISPSKYRLAPGSDHKLFVEREQASLIAG
jgi:uncharacterized protein involved in propanediol utilization